MELQQKKLAKLVFFFNYFFFFIFSFKFLILYSFDLFFHQYKISKIGKI